MKKILVATVKPFAKEAVDNIKNITEAAGNEFLLLEKYDGPEELKKSVEDVDALIVRSDKIDKEIIEAANNLKIIVRAGAGYDNIDLEAASAKDIVVMNTPGQNSNAVAELAFGMMVYIARNSFSGTAGTELRNKTLGIHAYGNVGKLVAEIAKGFNMDVYAYDPFIDKEVIENDGVKCLDSAEKLYSTCQYISLHIPANEKTKGSINFELLSLMPKNAVLVNTARKEVIDEHGLKRIFDQRNDFRYVTDIAPDCKDEIEANYPGKFFFTPKKMGAQTAEANINAGIAAAKQINNFFESGDETFRVN